MGKKVIIIGAGPGGLTAGMILSSHGYKVEIYEQHDKVGGRNQAIHLGDYTFDTGPTFFMMNDVLENVFKLSEKNVHDYINIIRLDPMYRLGFGDGRELMMFSDKNKMGEALEEFSPGSSEGYYNYLAREERKFNALMPCLEIPYQSFTDLLSMRILKSMPYLDLTKSLYGVLSKYFKDPLVRIAFTFQAKYIGMSPWEAPGLFSMISFIEHGGGVYHVEGGLNKISEAMAQVIKENGGKIFLESKVKEILVDRKKAIGIELENGSIHLADDVIINADFAHAMTKLIPSQYRKKYTDKALENKKYSCSTFMLYLGVNKKFDHLPHHSILFANDYKQNVDEITQSKVISEDFSFYVQNASVTDSTLAPEGKSTLYLLVPVPNQKSGIDWAKESEHLRERVLEALEKRGGYEGVRQAIEEELIITPDNWEDNMSVYKGATFNLAHNLGQMLMFRPHNKFEELDHCYLVGGGTHPGSGLPTIYESGRISSELILKRDKVKL